MDIRYLPVCYSDDRGSIRDLFPFSAPDSVTLIESMAGSVRGNHVHDYSTQYALVVSGRMWSYHRDASGVVRRSILHPGDMVTHRPGEEHAYLAESHATFLAFANGLRRGSDYERDTRRVPSLVEEWASAHPSLICSVLIPSRARPRRLLASVASLLETSDPGSAEILVRIDDDDAASLAIVPDLEEIGVRVSVGARGRGYEQLACFYDDLARLAEAPWIWVMNDDARVVGRGWNRLLRALPLDGRVAQAEIYQLGMSRYRHCEGNAFPIVPTRAWQRIGHPVAQGPIDTWIDQISRGAGWSTAFLDGVEVVHDRDPDDQIAKHRL